VGSPSPQNKSSSPPSVLRQAPFYSKKKDKFKYGSERKDKPSKIKESHLEAGTNLKGQKG
jgi:hypothetical protein